MRTIPRQYKTRKRKELDAAIAAVEKLTKGIDNTNNVSFMENVAWAEHYLSEAKSDMIAAWGPK